MHHVAKKGRRSAGLLTLLALAALLAGLAPAGPAGAQTHSIVTFDGHVPNTRTEPLDLQGRLVRPNGTGPFPAVIVLHGSGGLWFDDDDPVNDPPHGNMFGPFDLWADQLVAEGYLVLFLDSFRPRGVWDFRERRPPEDAFLAPSYERSRDAYDALAYLRTRPDVDPLRVALLGFSHGGGGVVGALVDGAAAIAEVGSGNFTVSDGATYSVPDPPVAPAFQGGFSCGVAYYPGAAFFGYYGTPSDPTDGFYRPYAPLLMIYGREDDFWGENGDEFPRKLRDKARYRGAHGLRGNNLQLSVYDNVDHGFDSFANDDPPAVETPIALAARDEALAFLAGCLVENPPAVPAETGAHFGATMAAGDFNGDGMADLAIGAPWADPAGRTDAGRVTVVLSARAEEMGLPDLTGPGVFHRYSGGSAGSSVVGGEFGHGLAVGDFDGDGIDDLAVGAPGALEGQVHVFYGSEEPAQLLAPGGRDILERDQSAFPGSGSVGDRFGEVLAAGNFNGDAWDDLALTSPGWSSYRGAAFAVYGGNQGLATFAVAVQAFSQGTGGLGETREAGDGYHMQVVAGDFDGSGLHDDLVVSYPTEDRNGADDGWLAVLRGTATGLSTANVLSFDQTAMYGTNPEVRDYFGRKLAVGDFDGDGAEDLAVASPGEDWTSSPNTGIAHVVWGSGSGLSTSGSDLLRSAVWDPGYSEDDTWFAADLAAGDFDADGVDDLVLGATNMQAGGINGGGRLFVAYGQQGVRTLQTTLGADPEDPVLLEFSRANNDLRDSPRYLAALGSTLVSADFNGDGADDVAVAAQWDTLGAVSEAGSVNVVYGRRITDGPVSNHEFGLVPQGSVFLRPQP